MTTETQKVDVLAAMDKVTRRLVSDGRRVNAGRLMEARAAVAELIEAAREVKTDAEVLGMTTNRLTAALARVGGASCDR